MNTSTLNKEWVTNIYLNISKIFPRVLYNVSWFINIPVQNPDLNLIFLIRIRGFYSVLNISVTRDRSSKINLSTGCLDLLFLTASLLHHFRSALSNEGILRRRSSHSRHGSSFVLLVWPISPDCYCRLSILAHHSTHHTVSCPSSCVILSIFPSLQLHLIGLRWIQRLIHSHSSVSWSPLGMMRGWTLFSPLLLASI